MPGISQTEVDYHLNISEDSILNPCPYFPEGIRVGDLLLATTPDDEKVLTTVVGKKEWANRTESGTRQFTDRDGICTKDSKQYDGDFYWNNDWEAIEFVARPRQQRTAPSGQLLMF